MGVLHQAVKMVNSKKRLISIERNFGKWLDQCRYCHRLVSWKAGKPKPQNCFHCEGVGE